MWHFLWVSVVECAWTFSWKISLSLLQRVALLTAWEIKGTREGEWEKVERERAVIQNLRTMLLWLFRLLDPLSYIEWAQDLHLREEEMWRDFLLILGICFHDLLCVLHYCMLGWTEVDHMYQTGPIMGAGRISKLMNELETEERKKN